MGGAHLWDNWCLGTGIHTVAGQTRGAEHQKHREKVSGFLGEQVRLYSYSDSMGTSEVPAIVGR